MKKTSFLVLLAILLTAATARAEIQKSSYQRKVPNRYIVEISEKKRSVIRQMASIVSGRFAGARVINIFDEVLGGFEIEATEPQALAISNFRGSRAYTKSPSVNSPPLITRTHGDGIESIKRHCPLMDSTTTTTPGYT